MGKQHGDTSRDGGAGEILTSPQRTGPGHQGAGPRTIPGLPSLVAACFLRHQPCDPGSPDGRHVSPSPATCLQLPRSSGIRWSSSNVSLPMVADRTSSYNASLLGLPADTYLLAQSEIQLSRLMEVLHNTCLLPLEAARRSLVLDRGWPASGPGMLLPGLWFLERRTQCLVKMSSSVHRHTRHRSSR
jgi:hypothetical protein